MRDEIPPGTLYMLILKTLAREGELPGFEIANSIQKISEDVLQVEEGSLYPALQRMLLKVGYRAVGRNGRKPPGALLQTHECRQETTGSCAVAVPARQPGDHPSDPNRIKEKVHGIVARTLAAADGVH
jgi:hypothetical protein